MGRIRYAGCGVVHSVTIIKPHLVPGSVRSPAPAFLESVDFNNERQWLKKEFSEVSLSFMKLSECPVGIPMIMVDLGCENKFCGRIRELGLRPGTRFTVTQKGAFGGRVLFVRGTRLAIDRGFAKRASARPCIQYAQKLGLEQEKAALEAALALHDLSPQFAPRLAACGIEADLNDISAQPCPIRNGE